MLIDIGKGFILSGGFDDNIDIEGLPIEILNVFLVVEFILFVVYNKTTLVEGAFCVQYTMDAVVLDEMCHGGFVGDIVYGDYFYCWVIQQ